MEDLNKYLPGYRVAAEEFAKRDPLEMAAKGDALYLEDYFALDYFGREYQVYYPTGKVTVPGERSGEEAGETRRKICFLHYLTQAKGGGPGSGWHAYRQLPGGDYHFSVFKAEALTPLLRKFGDNHHLFRVASEAAGGRENGMGDAGFTFRVLPRVNIGIVLYAGDEEEEATANIIFDDLAGENLPTDDLTFLAEDLVRRLIRYGEGGVK